jgi:dihydropteroate synthase
MPDAAPVRVMGILNATPDSFSDGGRFLDPGAALAQGRRMAAEGAEILDIGGESTRPGAPAVDPETEVSRVVPLITALRAETAITLSVDTMKPQVARAAVAAGADIWNDVSALTWAPDSAEVAAELGCQVVLMHMRGDPRTMQAAPRYVDVVGEVEAYLLARAEAALAAGVARDRIWLDPGIGFGKTLAHNLALLARLDRFVALGFPVLLGVSRKSFIKAIDAAAQDPGDRLGGSLAGALAGARAGVAAVRVHDVAETVQALAVERALSQAR